MNIYNSIYGYKKVAFPYPLKYGKDQPLYQWHALKTDSCGYYSSSRCSWAVPGFVECIPVFNQNYISLVGGK